MSQQILVGTILVRRSGVSSKSQRCFVGTRTVPDQETPQGNPVRILLHVSEFPEGIHSRRFPGETVIRQFGNPAICGKRTCVGFLLDQTRSPNFTRPASAIYSPASRRGQDKRGFPEGPRILTFCNMLPYVRMCCHILPDFATLYHHVLSHFGRIFP